MKAVEGILLKFDGKSASVMSLNVNGLEFRICPSFYFQKSLLNQPKDGKPYFYFGC